MADTLLERPGAPRILRDVTAWDRLKVHRDWLGLWFMLPAMAVAAFSPTEPRPPAVSERFAASRNGKRLGSSDHILLLS